MSHFLFDQLQFARQGTLRMIKDITESQADIIPEGFNNNIRWNLGHIYLVHALLAQDRAPSGYGSLFKMGSKPAEWTVQPPALPELLELLEAQPNQIQEQHLHRLNESITTPVTISSKLTLSTIEECLTFALYHEGGHQQAIKTLKKLI
jgi:hypothetical protein